MSSVGRAGDPGRPLDVEAAAAGEAEATSAAAPGSAAGPDAEALAAARATVTRGSKGPVVLDLDPTIREGFWKSPPPWAPAQEPAKPEAPKPAEAPKDEVAVRGGAKGAWNDLVANLDKLDDLKLADTAERELRGMIARELAKSAPGAPEQHRNELAAKLAATIRQAKLKGVGVESLASGAQAMISDMAGYLKKRVTFTERVAEVKSEVKARGGLNPGEDAAINKELKPLAEDLAKEEAKLKTTPYANGDLKLDWGQVFKDVGKFATAVDATAGIKFERGDFKAQVQAQIEVKGPLTKDSTARVSGFAEVESGRFGARVEGEAVVKGLYTDPKLGDKARLAATLRYTDESVKAKLTGTVEIPLENPEAKAKWSVGARVDADLGKGVGTFAEGRVANDPARGPSYSGQVGLAVKW